MTEQEGGVILVTGGSQGNGRAVALTIAGHGGALVAHGLTENSAREAAEEIAVGGGTATATWGPITSRSAVETALFEYGRLDTLVASAGIQRYGDVLSTSVETWDEVFAVNVKGVFLAAQAALSHLRKGPAGSIAIVASVQATATQKQVAAYAASKGALITLTRSMAVDEAAFGVRVNSVSLGSVDTPMLRSAAQMFGDASSAGTDETMATWGRAHPLGRIATAAEIAEVVSFVTSTRASFLTGADIRVDGGLLSQLATPLPAVSAIPLNRPPTHSSTG
ncbi:MAG: SDR family oxidoreductase [Microbacteriaceae bacterium]|nr:MAG: SDR family oxidoreductase [Microbacteriaceae bacterium]